MIRSFLTSTIVYIAYLLLPQAAYALYTINDIKTTSFTDISSFVSFIIGAIFSPLVTIFISLGVIAFVYGIAKYVYSGGDAKQREQGRKMMVYGIVAIFVMVSFWGLAKLIANTFGF
jgi:hypothetical protein